MKTLTIDADDDVARDIEVYYKGRKIHNVVSLTLYSKDINDIEFNDIARLGK